jgi:hypothetical protein
VVQALEKLGPGAESAVIPYLDITNGYTREWAAKVLATIGTKKCLPELKKLADKAKGAEKQAAENAIKTVGGRIEAP